MLASLGWSLAVKRRTVGRSWRGFKVRVGFCLFCLGFGGGIFFYRLIIELCFSVYEMWN